MSLTEYFKVLYKVHILHLYMFLFEIFSETDIVFFSQTFYLDIYILQLSDVLSQRLTDLRFLSIDFLNTFLLTFLLTYRVFAEGVQVLHFNSATEAAL